MELWAYYDNHTTFRDFQVAAPLKLQEEFAEGRAIAAFRDFQVAAPLKRVFVDRQYVPSLRFPRLPSRGPIEATASK